MKIPIFVILIISAIIPNELLAKSVKIPIKIESILNNDAISGLEKKEQIIRSDNVVVILDNNAIQFIKYLDQCRSMAYQESKKGFLGLGIPDVFGSMKEDERALESHSVRSIFSTSLNVALKKYWKDVSFSDSVENINVDNINYDILIFDMRAMKKCKEDYQHPFKIIYEITIINLNNEEYFKYENESSLSKIYKYTGIKCSVFSCNYQILDKKILESYASMPINKMFGE